MMRCGERGARSGDCSSLMLPGRPGLGHRPTRPHLLCTVGPECTLGPDGFLPQSGSHSCPDLCPSCPSSSVMKFNFGKYLTNLIIKYFKIFLNLKILYKPEYNIHSDGKREI